MNKILLASLLCGSFMMQSCQEELAFETEQYKKQVYLVGACEDILEKKIPYGGEQEFFVSVAVGGSTVADKDIVVSLDIADKSNIDLYNKKFVIEGDVLYQQLAEDWYSFPSKEVIIPAGEAYVRVPIKLNTEKIDCDNRYMLPLKIENVSDFQIVEKDTVLLVSPRMINKFSGNFTVEGSYQEVNAEGELVGNVSVLNTNRVLTAVSKDQVRFYHKATLERPDKLAESGLVVTVNPDYSVVVSAWDGEKLKIEQSGGVYYPENHLFDIWYDYHDRNKVYRMKLMMKGVQEFK